MGKDNEIGARIERLRKSQKMNQADFSEAIGVSSGRQSEWESGTAIPSAEGYVKLAAQAAKSDPDEALFFWTQAGLEPDAVMSVANILLKKGNVKMDEILVTAEEKLKDRVGDQKQMADEGKVVLVPPFSEGPSAAPGPVLSVPALLVPNKASVYYIVGQSDPLEIVRRGFAPGDFIFFDASEAGTGEILERLIGEEVFVRLRRSNEHAGPHTLFIGRPGFYYEQLDKGPKHMALFPSDVAPFVWSHDAQHASLAMAKIGASWRESGMERRRQSQITQPHEMAHYEKARPFWYEYSECQVLGKVVARFNAGTVELWKRQARGPA